MNKKIVYSLVLIGLFVLVLLQTSGSCRVDLLFDTLSASTSLVMLGSAALGVVVGLLLK